MRTRKQVVSGDEEARRRAEESLALRVEAGRAYRGDVPERARQRFARAVEIEAGVTLAVLTGTFARAGAVELLWPSTIEGLGEAGAVVMARWQQRGRKP